MKQKLSCFRNLQLEAKFCEDLVNWWKVHEAQFLVVGYLAHLILGIVKSQIETKSIFSIVGILIKLCSYQFGTQYLNQLVLISKNWPNDPRFGCESFVIESLDDFGDLEVNLLEQMEKEF